MQKIHSPHFSVFQTSPESIIRSSISQYLQRCFCEKPKCQHVTVMFFNKTVKKKEYLSFVLSLYKTSPFISAHKYSSQKIYHWTAYKQVDKLLPYFYLPYFLILCFHVLGKKATAKIFILKLLKAIPQNQLFSTACKSSQDIRGSLYFCPVIYPASIQSMSMTCRENLESL